MKQDAEIRNFLIERGIEHVKIGVFDTDGILRGKYLSRDKFLVGARQESRILRRGSGLGLERPALRQHQVHRLAYRLSRCRGAGPARHPPRHSRSSRRPRCFSASSPAAPKRSARAARCGACCERAADMGYAVSAAAEFEFFMFEETPQSVRDKGYRQLKTMTPGAFGYSVLRSSVHSDLYHELLDLGQTMRFPIEGLHTETGPGVLEAALDLLRGARGRRPRGAVQDLRQGARAAPRPDGDVHGEMVQQRSGPERPSAYFAAHAPTATACSTIPSKPHEMSDAMRWFVGGQQALMPELLAMVAGTVNSYSRLVPGYWAPTSATWGIENRTTALRVIRGGPSSQRVEYRIAAADINPVHRAGRGHRLRALGHRAPHRAGCAHRGQRLRPRASAAPAPARDAVRGRRTPGRVQAGARAVRRCVRRALRRHPPMGRAGIPQGDHRLGTRPLFRDHLSARMTETLKTISPVDGRIYVERPLAVRPPASTARSMPRGRAQRGVGRVAAGRRAATILEQAVDAFVAKANDIAAEITWQMGRPIRHAPGEVRGFEERARYMLEVAPAALAAVRPGDKAGFERQIKRVPLGVVAVVAPWNYPYLTAVNAVLPALIAGNAVVLKHSHQTPLCAERFLEAFASAGVPAGVFQYLHLSHADTARLMGDAARRQRLLHRLGGGRPRGGRGDRGRVCDRRPGARRQGSGLRARRRQPRARHRNLDRRRVLQCRPILLRHQAHLCRGIALRGVRRRRGRADPEVPAGIAARSAKRRSGRWCAPPPPRRSAPRCAMRSRAARTPADRRGVVRGQPRRERRTSRRRCWSTSITRCPSCAKRPSGRRSAS